MVLPGFGASDPLMAPLRWYLGQLGYVPLPWGIGRNRGRPERDAERIVKRIEGLDVGPMHLVGWSLGGVVARLVARALPERVAQVITLGSPVEGGPKYTSAARWFRKSLDLDAFEEHVHAINSEGLQVPVTAIYSTSDAIVGWRAAIDRYNPHTRHLQLRTASHVGLPYNPRVWAKIAQTLAAPPRPARLGCTGA